jgi:hypothetical protein
MITPETYILFGIPTMFLVVGLFAYGLVRLDAYRHPRASKQPKDEGAGRDASA